MTHRNLHSSEIRHLFLRFFEKNAHLRIPTSRLVPKNDPTLLYVNSGMAPLKDYFTGAAKPPNPTMVNVQTCIRTRDIDDVGDRHHLTLFEMMGQWSIGDYFKQKAAELSLELLVDEFKFDIGKLFVTCYGGDASLGIPRDIETYEAWRGLGIPEDRIVYLGSDNFWGPAGDTGPCGPCTEVFYDTGDAYGPPYVPGREFDSSSRYIEIWNAGVFMQYDKLADSTLASLPFNSVDTGSGLERMTMILNDVETVYETDLMKPTMNAIADRLGSAHTIKDCRMLTDHLRAGVFILAEGVRPGNDKRAYIPRRLLRKCIAVTARAELPGFDYQGVLNGLVDQFQDEYPHLEAHRNDILDAFHTEKREFERTLRRGLDKLEQLCSGTAANITGQQAFDLFQSYGLPFDIIRDVVAEKKGTIDEESYTQAFSAHQKISQGTNTKSQKKNSPWPQDAHPYRSLPDARTQCEFVGYHSMTSEGSVLLLLAAGTQIEEAQTGDFVEVLTNRTPFYAESGGQAGDTGVIQAPSGTLTVIDTQQMLGRIRVHRCQVQSGTIAIGDKLLMKVDDSNRRDVMCNHSGTHILHAVLRELLGDHVKQAGSQVDAARLRFDFDHHQKVEQTMLAEVERRVNLHIRQNVECQTVETSYDDAIAKGALAFFGDTYGDIVRLVQFDSVSTELCGGTHVVRTGDIGMFRIVSEASVASGVRRITAVTGRRAVEFTLEQSQMLSTIALQLKSGVSDIPERIKILSAKKTKPGPSSLAHSTTLQHQAQTSPAGISYVAARLNGGAAILRKEALRLADQIEGVVALVGEDSGKARMVVAVTKKLTKKLNANILMKQVAPLIDGRGGGKPHLAEGGGLNPGGIDAFIADFPKALDA